MKTFAILCLLLFLFLTGTAQRIQTIDANISAGRYQGALALGYLHDWQFGKHRRVDVGIGARFTSFLGADKYYITAPSKLTSGVTDPSALFVENFTENIDTFIIKYPQVNSLN